MENFREISDIALKDIYASDELKRKTLEKCTYRRSFKINPAVLSTASAAVLIIAIVLCNYFFHYPIIAINTHVNDQIKNEYKNPVDNGSSLPLQIISENKLDEEDKSSIKKENYASIDKTLDPGTQSSNNTADSSGGTLQNEIDNSQHISSAFNQEHALTSAIKLLNLDDAEKYFGSSILFPQYMPEGLSLTSISIPDDKLKCIKLSYNSRTAYFEILQNKNLSELEGTKTITIGNNNAYVNYTKDENSNIKTTTITWIMNSIQYSLSGNLPESFLINIAKYLN